MMIDRTVESHLPLVHMVAKKLARRLPRGVEVDDLVSAGTLGLLDAASRFEPTRAATFKGYAEIRIRGAMMDWLRTSDWLPRSVRAAVRREESSAAVVSIEDVSEEGYDNVSAPAIAPFAQMAVRQRKERLTAAIAKLPRREREVLSLYHLEDLTFRQIGGMYGFSEARACQLHTAAVAHLREELCDDVDL